MSLLNEYVVADAVRSIDDVIVYRAEHPIHGRVNIYLPDETLPPQVAIDARRRLYKSGRQMRNISLLNIPFIIKSLEVSQNPNEPYIVTKHTDHDLEDLVSNGVTLTPKRIFTILSQVLQAIVNLELNDWMLDSLYPRQIKLSDLHTGDIGLTLIEGAEQRITVTKTVVAGRKYEAGGMLGSENKTEEDNNESPAIVEQAGDEIKASKDAVIVSTASRNIDLTSTFEESGSIKQSRAKKRNIYLLGNITYQLLFGRKYQSGSKIAETDLGSLSRRWRKFLKKALHRDSNRCFDAYKTMLCDAKKALNRNKRLAVASIPFWVALVIMGSYFAYQQYHQHKIMTSEAGQAIESFLNIVNKADDKLPELEKPKPVDSGPDDETILKPLDKIQTISEE